MQKSDFLYTLPPELIAQTPIEPRNASRLLCVNRGNGDITHRRFYELSELLSPGDLLVMNDSRVIPARIFGVKRNEYGNGAVVEFLLLRQISSDTWETLVRPGKRAKPGAVFDFFLAKSSADGDVSDNNLPKAHLSESHVVMTAHILEIADGGNRLVRFTKPDSEAFENAAEMLNVLEKIGQMPLPPYITEKLSDKERYQTVYSHEPGSAAAPTAGLHFTPEQLDDLRTKGIDTAFVTLHVGLGTFRPVKEDNILDHKMHTEHYFIPSTTAEKISRTKASGNRVICVGTTSCRTLESAWTTINEPCVPGSFRLDDIKEKPETKPDWVGAAPTEAHGDTDIFIYPGYKFKVMDGLITNFHLPESTLIMLVSAFLGYENTMNAYKTAVDERYRFFSFGDAMLIL